MGHTIAHPIVREIPDTREALEAFEKEELLQDSKKVQTIISDYPTVYIHNWKESGQFDVYIGEANNIFKRTRQHYDLQDDHTKWQSQMVGKDPRLYIIGHEHFNKSLTLDVENRLMHYMLSVDSVKHVHNGRDNPQNNYYPQEEFEDIFRSIWKQLHKDNRELFPSENKIKDSAIYKASPLHKLTPEQEHAQELIVHKVMCALNQKERNQIIFIDGEAGTGKTVLNSSTFYELYCEAEENNREISCHLLVNHDEQIVVYQQIADKLGLTSKYGTVVNKPTSFINSHTTSNPVDVVFVDEAHLLLTQGKQSYRGQNQLQDIIERARVTVVMFDENQILTTEQYWESEILNGFRSQAIEKHNHIVLDKQLRMQVDEQTMDWIDAFTKRKTLQKLPKSKQGKYKIVTFDTPEELDEAIISKANDSDSKLSRVIATYDWPYSSKKTPEDETYWEVKIGDWHKPWNRELEKELSRKEKKRIKEQAWAEQTQTIGEVGSTFTIQGFDLNYAGVILGPSVKYKDGNIIFDPSKSFNQKATRNRTLSDGKKQKFGESLLQHEVRVLMTRGVQGLYIYACDPELRKVLKEALK